MKNIDFSEYLKIAYGYIKDNKYDLALKKLKVLSEENRSNEMAFFEIGKIYKMMNKCSEATKNFIEAVRINPNNKELLKELGEVSYLCNSHDLAQKEFEEIVKKFPLNEQAHIELSKIFIKNCDYDKGLNELYKALAINKDNSEIYICFSQIYKAKKNREKMLLNLKQAAKINPDNKHVHLELGGIYEEEKDYESAVKEITEAKKLSPLDTKVRLKLLQLYVLQGKHNLSDKEASEILSLRSDSMFVKDSVLNEIEILQKKTVLKSKVKRLWVTLTSKCNIRCRTCGLWSTPWDIPEKTVKEVIDYYPYLERVVWLGGEVFLYKSFDELFQKASVFPNLRQQLITNGVILTEEWIEKIMSANTELTISVDGVTKDVYEYIRRGASFEKLISNIKLAVKIRKKLSSKTPMRLNAVIMKSNYHQLEDFLDFAKEFGFEQLSIMAIHLDNDPEENIIYSKQDPKVSEYLTDAIPRLKQKARDYSIDLDILLPTLDLKFDTFKNDKEANELLSDEGKLHCIMPWKYMFICDKGTVYLTGSCSKPIGNVYSNTLDEIWNSEEAQFYRENILKNQFQEICRPECMTRWEI